LNSKANFIGHRGAKGEKSENTLCAIKYALDLGLQGVEIDVHSTLDNQLIVIHDAHLDRTTHSTGPVAQKTLKQIKQIQTKEFEKIPTLEEVVDLVKSYGKCLMIELKAAHLEKKVYELIRTKDYIMHCIVKSFNHKWLKNIKELDNTLQTHCLSQDALPDPIKTLKTFQADGLSVPTRIINQKLITLCHQHNYKITTWNANGLSELIRFQDMGVDYICTDYPKLIPALPS
jgi:glycerophosphoryl diester phosphodiesterase